MIDENNSAIPIEEPEPEKSYAKFWVLFVLGFIGLIALSMFILYNYTFDQYANTVTKADCKVHGLNTEYAPNARGGKIETGTRVITECGNFLFAERIKTDTVLPLQGNTYDFLLTKSGERIISFSESTTPPVEG